MYDKNFYQEKELRKNKIVAELEKQNIDAILLADNANQYYVSERVYSGFTFINRNGVELFFVKRPVQLHGDDVIYIKKPELITDALKEKGIELPKTVALEFDTATYNEIQRLKKVFPEAEVFNGSAIMRTVRSIKTEYEIAKIKEGAIKHAVAYKHIPKIYKQGMSDIELQIEIERTMRLEGSLGIFRISGSSMEIFMGNLLCGKNADNPTPYDFAMGGAGLNRSLPIGSNGTLINHGNSVMVDMGGNFNGYMTDMTRVFYTGKLPELAIKAHNLSIAITQHLAKIAVPGTKASFLYEEAMRMVNEAGMQDYFMGHNQKAGFIGHGVGIEINELPVLAPRSRDIIQLNQVIAIEPKFVIPEVGGMGIENTYLVTENGLERITNLTEDLIEIN